MVLSSLSHTGIVDAENDDNWLWFITTLRNDVISQHAPAYLAPGVLTFISDRQKGLLEGIASIFPNSAHGYCLRHLYENFNKVFKHKDLHALLYQAARATTAAAVNDAMAKMQAIAPESVPWLLDHAAPEHWVEYYFPGRRYGHITSNIIESLNAWLLEARNKPILVMVEQIRQQLMQWFNQRRDVDQNTQGLLVSTAAAKIQSLMLRARRYRLIKATDDVYEIYSTPTMREYVVIVNTRTCTCFEWQHTGIPCSHAVAVSLMREEDPQQYAQGFYTLAAYRQTYENPIFPPNVDAADAVQQFTGIESDGEDPGQSILPPKTRCPPGRPKKKRIRSARERGDRATHVYRCTRCGQSGHQGRTCRRAI
jgi:hypothetical protein